MNIEGGLFFTIIAVSFMVLVLPLKYKEYFYFLPVGMFLILGFWLLSGATVSFVSSSTDGITVVNSTTYLIGDATNTYNINTPWLGLFFLLASIILAFLAFLGLTDPQTKSK